MLAVTGRDYVHGTEFRPIRIHSVGFYFLIKVCGAEQFAVQDRKLSIR